MGSLLPKLNVNPVSQISFHKTVQLQLLQGAKPQSRKQEDARCPAACP
jgi:hypothetical protein